MDMSEDASSSEDCSSSTLRKVWKFRSSVTSTSQEPKVSTSDYSKCPMSVSNMKKEQKRRPKPKDGSVLFCGVCGDKAMGYNFDAITCESCKAFFRRNATKTKVFTCSFDGNCKMDTHTRKFCSGCRLKKCFEIGMRKDWILSEDQLSKRRHKPRPSSSPSSSSGPLKYESATPPEVTSNFTGYDYLGSNAEADFSPTKSEIEESEDEPKPCPEDILIQIKNIEEKYDSCFNSAYTEEQADRLKTPSSANELFNMTDIFIRRLIKFAKKIPEFNKLKQEDQIHLLKGGIMEILVLRSAMGFNKQSSVWQFKTAAASKEEKIKLDPSVIAKNLGQSMYADHISFVKSLHELTQSNSTIMTLLFIIELFSSDRPNLQDKDAVSEGQEKFSYWLKLYLESIYPRNEAKNVYPKLLLKLLDVRNLGEFSASMASQLDVSKMEPLLVEIFSLTK
ncbi:hypothetical protein ScPMuIL_000965 [Solemya velum]